MTEADLCLRLTDLGEVGLLLVGDDNVIRVANATAHRLLRRRALDLAGRTILEAFLDHRVSELVEVARSAGTGHREIDLGGEPQQTFLLHATRADAGDATWLVVRDLSELRRLRRIRAEFIDNLSHELRTPLTNVRLLAETLALEIGAGDEMTPRMRESIARIDVETGHLATMVTELLDLARIEQGDVAMRHEAVDVRSVVTSVLERLRPYAERQQVGLRTEDEPGSDLTVTGDSERLEQLLVNLVHNAIKFSPTNAQVVVRERRQSGESASVLVAVEDDGPGIPRRDLERIFERFYKVDRARTRVQAGGTGLGLAIARHIAEAHGGRVWAESVEGNGATFLVALPAASTTASPVGRAAPASAVCRRRHAAAARSRSGRSPLS